MHDHWQKIAALLVFKQGGHVVISIADIAGIPGGLFMTTYELNDGIHLRLVDEATANQLARKEGGLPS